MEVKPGVKTTEFWATLSGVVVALLVSLRVVPATEVPQVSAWLTAAATNIVALLTAGGLIATYIRGRVQAKQAAAIWGPPTASQGMLPGPPPS